VCHDDFYSAGRAAVARNSERARLQKRLIFAAWKDMKSKSGPDGRPRADGASI
jgi:hypothetical protein